MAVTITKVSFTGDTQYRRKPSTTGELVIDVAFDDEYPTGGETLDVSTWLSTVTSLVHIPSDLEAEGLAGARVYAHDKGTAAAGKVLVYLEDAVSGIYAEEADMTDLSTLTAVRFRLTGALASNYGAAQPTSTSGKGAF